MERIPIIIIY